MDNTAVKKKILFLKIYNYFLQIIKKRNNGIIDVGQKGYNGEVYFLIGPLNKGSNIIGRGNSCCFKVYSFLCNVFHCIIKFENNMIMIKDLYTSNGTFVDGNRLSGGIFTQIFSNSTIEFGRKSYDEAGYLWIFREIIELLDEPEDLLGYFR